MIALPLRRRCLALLAGIGLLGAHAESVSATPSHGEIKVAAASDLTFVLEELNAAFRAAHADTTVKVTTGASGSLFAQLKQGAPFDVFLSADLNFPRELVKAGVAEEASLTTYAVGHLVLWTTKTNVSVTSGFAILTNPLVTRVAIANPATAPYGRAAKAALTHAGVWDAVQPKLVLGENIAQTAQFVQSGNVDAGLVGLSLVSAPKLAGVGTWWPVPESAHPRLEQGGVLTAHGATNELARAYLQFLRSEPARAIFDRFGFRLPAK
jgi:molybdate transport system substrate-binding protein